MVRLYEVVSRIRIGESEVAKILLDAWNEEADDYTGAIEIADVYIEINCFEEACLKFEKEWESYYCMPYIVSRYAYTLLQLGKVEACKEIINLNTIFTQQVDASYSAVSSTKMQGI